MVSCTSPWSFGLIASLALFGFSGCTGNTSPDLVVYTALDAEFSEQVLNDFARESGIDVAPKFDTEANKTVGLANAIINEGLPPRCDVFWNNEILNTLRLQERGLLHAYLSPQADRFPAIFRSPDGLWHGFAARARVLLVNTKLVPPDERPGSITDLTNEKWRGRCCIAKPLFGTTATHAACLFAHWGDDKAREFFLRLKQNEVHIVPGNKQVATGVAAGRYAFGLTDTDDAIIAIEQGHPVEIVYPDRQQHELGTLFIPNTVAIIKDTPHLAAATKLVEHLLSAEVETRLAQGRSAQIPLANDVDVPQRIETPRSVKAMPADFAAAARRWDDVHAFLRETFGAD
jgi:iron(III) transport system substrate-binding protein